MTQPIAEAAPAADQIVTLGRDGCSRAEIAVALGLDEPALRRLADQRPELAAALVRADTEARAWWDRLPRLAVTKGDQFHPAVWSKAMAQRYGSQSHRPRPNVPGGPDRAPRTETPDQEPFRFEIPDNGRERRPRRP